MDALSNLATAQDASYPFVGIAYHHLQCQGTANRISLTGDFIKAARGERYLRILPDPRNGRLVFIPESSMAADMLDDSMQRVSITRGDRITCPKSLEPLLLEGNPEKSVVCVGSWDRFEVWNPNQWSKECARRKKIVGEAGLFDDFILSDPQTADYKIDHKYRLYLPRDFIAYNPQSKVVAVLGASFGAKPLRIIHWDDADAQLSSLSMPERRNLACAVSLGTIQDKRIVLPRLNRNFSPDDTAFCISHGGLVEVFSSTSARRSALTNLPSNLGQNRLGPLCGGVSGAPHPR